MSCIGRVFFQLAMSQKKKIHITPEGFVYENSIDHQSRIRGKLGSLACCLRRRRR
jgi:hypothetical protein